MKTTGRSGSRSTRARASAKPSRSGSATSVTSTSSGFCSAQARASGLLANSTTSNPPRVSDPERNRRSGSSSSTRRRRAMLQALRNLKLVQAIGTETVREARLGALADVHLDGMPPAVLVADLLALRAGGEEPPEDLALGDIGADADHLNGFAGGVAEDAAAPLDPPDAVGTHNPEFALEFVHAALDGLDDAGLHAIK